MNKIGINRMKREKKFLIYFYKIMPKNLISRFLGFISKIAWPKYLLNIIINMYIKKFNVNVNEIDIPGCGFKNFDNFFTRKLKKGIHNIDNSNNSIISPVDARVDQFGKISDSTIIQAKNLDYSLNDLLPSQKAEIFKNGSFITLYLSPGDYHRIHSPVNGKITGFFNIPGKLYTVQDYMVQGLNNLFSLNERIISYIDTDKGKVAVCKIGAMGVGKISLSYSHVISNRLFRKKREFFIKSEDQRDIKKGEEIGIFHMGSTVILLFEKGTMSFADIKRGSRVRMGEKIGLFN